MQQQERWLIEARDRQSGAWEYEAVCSGLSLEDCLCESQDEAEKIISQISEWAGWAGEYRARAIAWEEGQ